MSRFYCTIPVAVSIALLNTSGLAKASEAQEIAAKIRMQSPRPERSDAKPKGPAEKVVIPKPEPASAAAATSSSQLENAFVASTAPAISTNSSLTAPVTISYAGTSTALSVTDSGTGSGKGIASYLTSTSSTGSALYGQTNGSGAGLTGYNGGTVGPGGKFVVTNASSAQAGAFASTDGTGPGLLATVTSTATDSGLHAAIVATNTSSSEGMGLNATGSYVGIYTDEPVNSSGSNQWGVFAENDGAGYGVVGYSLGTAIGVLGQTQGGSGVALEGISNDNYAVYASNTSGASAIYAIAGDQNSDAFAGVEGHGVQGYGVRGITTGDAGFAISGEATGGGIGVFGTSDTGPAGYFTGNVTVTEQLTTGTLVYSSDRNLKTDVLPLDGKTLLDRVAGLPITSWDYKSDTTRRHIGPMAQDFHEAFGLNGSDDTHIGASDIGGVSLAAVQELYRQLNAQKADKDARIAALEAQVAAQTKVMAEMSASFSARMAALESHQVIATQATALKTVSNARAVVKD